MNDFVLCPNIRNANFGADERHLFAKKCGEAERIDVWSCTDNKCSATGWLLIASGSQGPVRDVKGRPNRDAEIVAISVAETFVARTFSIFQWFNDAATSACESYCVLVESYGDMMPEPSLECQ